MIELLFAGLIIGASVTILGLHISKRLRPMRGAEATTYAGNQFSAIGMDLTGRGGPETDPRYNRMVAEVLKEPASESGFRMLLP